MLEVKKEIKEIYITKYCLTDGIIKENCEIDYYPDGKKMAVPVNRHGCFQAYFHSNEFLFSLKEAKEKAEKMRIKKIQSLRKQIEKLEKLVF